MASKDEENYFNGLLHAPEKFITKKKNPISKKKNDVNLQDYQPINCEEKAKKELKHNKSEFSEPIEIDKPNEEKTGFTTIPYKLELFYPIEKPRILPIERVDCLFHYSEEYQLLVLNDQIYNIIIIKNDIKGKKKFVICQLLESKGSKTKYLLYIRSGKLENSSKSFITRFDNLDMALKKFQFLSEYWFKQGFVQEESDFSEIINLKERPLIIKPLNYLNDAKLLKRASRNSKLEKNVQIILKKMLIDNFENSQLVVQKNGFDIDQLPISKLSKNRINLGNRQLGKISSVLTNSKDGNLYKLSENFFTSIPHIFGVKNIFDFVINSKSKLNIELEMMENLESLRISNKLLSNDSGSSNYLLDSFYDKLKIKVNAINKKTEEFRILDMMVKNTKGPIDNFCCELINGFRIDRPIDKLKYLKHIGNDHLLFFTDKFKLCSKFFLNKKEIDTDESSKSGSITKGIYFTDIITKSANSSRSKIEQENGLILVCKVALGNISYSLDPQEKDEELQESKNSRVILGKYFHDPKEGVEFGGTKVYCGPNISIMDSAKQDYSDFIVFDEDQIQLKYLLFVNLIESKTN